MQPARALLLFMALGAAGCVDDVRDRGGSTAADDAGTLALRFEECSHQLGFFPIDPDEARSLLPPGFTPVGMVPGQADLLVLTTVCERLAEDGEPMQDALTGILVEPPADLAHPDAGLQFVYTALFTSSAAAAATYGDWGLAATFGSLDVALDAAGMPAATGEAGLGSAQLRTAVAGGASPASAGSVRGFAEMDGRIVAVDYAFTDYLLRMGTAVLQDPQGVTGLAAALRAGVGYHEYGEGYGLVLTPVALPMQ